MASPNALFATLRPGDAPPWLAALLGSARRSSPNGDYFEWDDKQLWLAANGDVANGDVAKAVCTASFPPDIAIEGLHIGMPIAAARGALPELHSPGAVNANLLHGWMPAGRPWGLLLEELEGKIRSISMLVRGALDRRLEEVVRERSDAARIWDAPPAADRWTMIDDPDALLEVWLGSQTTRAPWSNTPAGIYAAYAAWLKAATPDQWHSAARFHNWSYSLGPLFFISRHPACELATALHILYAADLRWVARFGFNPAAVPTHSHATLRLITGICDRIRRDCYARSLAFDPARDFGRNAPRIDLGPGFPAQLEGREPRPVPFDDGYPIAVWEAVGVVYTH
ncbi:hypothetical protein FHS95_001748 [Sphingomonas naasensis]|uniref:DUF4274 domain-containing protein n=1 Tax=Sphingomonas naasensis TaxID=1344951 RepID=A0A4S1WLP9_9SPHN|nr:DUF4274 domain-containing protein [Sphingomonas naasensis]NIJ20056.1 hypothetical protein [Sphingomonas naasensis]TGX44218.1 DUF4274 domain-containing protein [Sphingomonas naasensis]